MSCHQMIDTNVIFRHVQDQVLQYRSNGSTSTGTTVTASNNAKQTTDTTFTTNTGTTTTSRCAIIPIEMKLQPCMTYAIRNHILNDTIVIPISISSSMLRPISNKTVTTTTTTTTTDVEASDSPYGRASSSLSSSSSTSTSIVQAEQHQFQLNYQPPSSPLSLPPLPPSVPPGSSPTGSNDASSSSSISSSSSSSSPVIIKQQHQQPQQQKLSPKSFPQLIRCTNTIGNRRQRSVSSESESSSSMSTTTITATTTTNGVPISPPTPRQRRYSRTKKDTGRLPPPLPLTTTTIETLPPVRFSTLMQQPQQLMSRGPPQVVVPSNTTSTTPTPTITNPSTIMNTIDVCGSVGTIVVLIRRPGCSLCQQQAYALTLLSQLACPEYFSSTTTTAVEAGQSATTRPMFTILGIVKDVYDTKGMIECQQQYFPFPLYINTTHTFYEAIGNRKLSLSRLLMNQQIWRTMLCNIYQSLFLSNTTSTTVPPISDIVVSNPIDTVYTKSESSSSLHRNDQTSISTTITNTNNNNNDPVTASSLSPSSLSYKGDGILQGGIIFFSNTATTTAKTGYVPIAMYPEETGQPLNISNILQTLDFMIQSKNRRIYTPTPSNQ